MSSQWWPAKESWWSHRTASRRGADCRTAKLGLKWGVATEWQFTRKYYEEPSGLGVPIFRQSCWFNGWNMLKRPVTSLSSLLCSHKQRICLQVAGSFDCSWSFATQRATDFAMENPRCYSVTIQMRQMASQEWCWATCAVFCHIPRMAISVISGRRLQPITYWIRQLAAEDEPLKAPSCPQSEEAAAYLWDLSNFWWLPSFRSGMTHDDDSWHNDS